MVVPGSMLPGRTLRLRWLGENVAYPDAHALQRRLWAAGPEADDWLLLLSHPPVYTAGVRAKAQHMLADPASVGAELLWVDRGGDITYHGPGQLVGYPVLSLQSGPSATPAYIYELESLVIEVLERVGLKDVGRLQGCPGVWVRPGGGTPTKICAIGARHSRRRTMHGFALNVATDLAMFRHIVPCGITDKGVTSLAAEGIDVSLREVAEVIFEVASRRWAEAVDGRPVERQDAAWGASQQRRGTGWPMGPETAADAGQEPPAGGAWQRPAGGGGAGRGQRPEPVRLVGRLGRLAAAGVDPSASLPVVARKPPWLRASAHMGPGYRDLHKTVHQLGLATVCEDAGCPNIFECWADGTATFMINGRDCTRACGFCEVSTGKPLALDPDEPRRVAEAVGRLGLAHAVVTCVARDDLPDGGASAFASTIDAIRERCPGTAVEVLISDCKGDASALAAIFERRPDVLNHNVETVPRLQRAVRAPASYARSLAVLSRAADAGLVTKSGLMVGLGETETEVLGVLADLHGAGVSIVTIGQYLRPTSSHLPVARWWSPEEFARLGEAGRALGLSEVVASPLTRSSYHARQAAASLGTATLPSAEKVGA